MRREAKDRGFTLVELLVALTLLGLLMVVLFGGLRFGTRAMTAATQTVDRTAELATAYDFLREALGNAQPLPAEGVAVPPPLRFAGDEHGLEFVILAPDNLGAGGFRLVDIGLDTASAMPRLVLRWGDAPRGENGSVPEIAPSVLIDRVEQVDFAYFGAAAEGEAAAWHPRWQTLPTLPRLIRVHVVLAGRRPVPDLVVALRLFNEGLAGPL
jgi:general secretion pathway protein J